ncbi:hypothetical protein [Carnobacterium sp. TMP28]|uniref:hypothetical protein n=1 Tax=Carnobacterium sp. TMP28 TaxID=3397060 RepID=UPI0039E0192B
MRRLIIVGLTSMMLVACANNDKQSDISTSQSSTESIPLSSNLVISKSNEKNKRGSISETNVSLESENKSNHSVDISGKREAAFNAVNKFLTVMLNEKSINYTDDEIRRERRETLEPFVTNELLKSLEPTDEELKEQGFPLPTKDSEYDSTISPVSNLMEVEYKLERRNIYIDEQSLNTKTVNILADAFYNFKTDMEGSIDTFDELRTYTFNIEKQDDNWIISEYEVISDKSIKKEN